MVYTFMFTLYEVLFELSVTHFGLFSIWLCTLCNFSMHFFCVCFFYRSCHEMFSSYDEVNVCS